jgi:transcription antitermination protein NusB
MTQLVPITSRQKSSARLYAVQAVYQMMVNDQNAADVVDDTLVFRVGMDADMNDVERPAVDLFRDIVAGVERTRGEISTVIGNHLKENDFKGMEGRDPLLFAILLCGGFELMGHLDIDTAIIINDYLDVTHSYYQGKESSIINGILDKLKVLYRPD